MQDRVHLILQPGALAQANRNRSPSSRAICWMISRVQVTWGWAPAPPPESETIVTEEIRILSPTAILGYGFPEASFQAGLARKPHLLAVDAGSTDPGPYYLGAGVSFTDRQAVQRDLRHMLIAGRKLGIPVVIDTSQPDFHGQELRLIDTDLGQVALARPEVLLRLMTRVDRG
jgi:hypothetical protein